MKKRKKKRLDVKSLLTLIIIIVTLYEVVSLGILLKYKKNIDEIKKLETNIKELNNTNDNLDIYIQELRREVSDNEILINEKEKTLASLEVKNTKRSESLKELDNIPTFYQYNGYPTGCESVALYLLLKFYDVDVSVDDVVDALPHGYETYTKNGKTYGPNPEKQFVGDPRSGGYSLGVFNEPIKEVANKFKSGAISITGLSFDKMLEIVDNGRPVVAWTSISLVEPYRYFLYYDAETDEPIYFIRNEHAVLVVGYTDSSIIISDPHTGSIRYQSISEFERVYDYLGKRVVYY